MSDPTIIYTDFGKRVDESYIGDAVYASHDSQHIWLRTGDGNDQNIALDRQVFHTLIAYAKRVGFTA